MIGNEWALHHNPKPLCSQLSLLPIRTIHHYSRMATPDSESMMSSVNCHPDLGQERGDLDQERGESGSAPEGEGSSILWKTTFLSAFSVSPSWATRVSFSKTQCQQAALPLPMLYWDRGLYKHGTRVTQSAKGGFLVTFMFPCRRAVKKTRYKRPPCCDLWFIGSF